MDRLFATIDRVDPVPPGPRRYVIAMALAVIAGAFTAVLHDWAGLAMPYLLGLGAVIIAAWLGGAGPALLAGVMMLLFAKLTAPELPSTDIRNLSAMGLFTIFLAVSGQAILWARRRAALHAWRLTQRELSLQSIFDSLPAAMIIVDRNGDILAVNNNAIELLADDAVGEDGVMLQNFLDIPDAPGAPELSFGDRLLALGSGPALVRGRRKEGGEVAQLTIATALLRTSGRDLITVYLRDETLARRAAKATAEVQASVAQLGRAAALGAMGSAIAHELNQPLASAANFAGAALTHLSREPGSSPLAIAAMESTVRQVVRASEILKGLRKFVRAAPLTPQWLDVADVVREAAQLGQFMLNDMRVTLEIDIADEARFVWMDRVQVQQVLVNLLNNAAEAVGSGEERVVRIRAHLLANDELELCVSDSGPGVAAEIRERLFEPFNTSKGQGLGVGLSISKSIIEAHGGNIWYDDQGPGARFCVTLKHSHRRDGDGGEQQEPGLHH